MRYMERGEFFEDDEPVEDVLAAFSAGQVVLTAGARTTPERGWTASVQISGQASPGDTYAASVACVHRP
jgi:hypothetical protein